MRLFSLFLFLIIYQVLASENKPVELTDKIPVDSNVVVGRLENGLSYYIRQNSEPQDRAELRLVVKAGSVLEDDDQLGLAHFVEHMAFNGTQNFEKQELVSFLESIGMRFGADINASTGFDQTIYMLELPTDSAEVFQKGFDILEDWAHRLSFDPAEIDKERGVVIEEWRYRRSANARMLDKQYPVLFHDSRYAERLPIGTKEMLETFDHAALKRFYQDWYRPNLMAVIAVGDFDINQVQGWIETHFKSLKNPDPARERINFPIPDHDETLFAIASDPEARFSSIGLYTKIDIEEEKTVADYRENIVKQLYSNMLNQRLSELTQKEDPPFLFASTGQSRFVKSRGFYVMNAVVNQNGINRGLDALLTEAERVARYGFTQSELEREKNSTMRGLEQAMREYDKQKSAVFASEYIRAFEFDEPIPGLPYEFSLYQKFIPGISVDEVNRIAGKWMKKKSRVVLVSLPEKEGVDIPTEESLKQVLDNFQNKEITAYKDAILDKPIADFPEKGAVVEKQTYNKDVDLTEWTLSNGVKVLLKPTDFKNDQILFSATSPGGLSLVQLDDLIPAETADGLARASGVGNYSMIDLQKLLADKVVNVSPYISEITEGFNGQVSPQDLETMLQIVYAYFSSPRMDEEAFSAYKKRMEAILENRDKSPGTAFSDTLTAVLTQHDPRSEPMQLEDLTKLDLQKSGEIFSQRFSDGDDFTFIFVGNFDLDNIKPLIEKYLGGLPVLPSSEKWSDETYSYPTGIHKKVVFKGIDPKSQYALVFTGPFDWNPKNRFEAIALTDILRIKLRERIREDKGGTYGVSVGGSYDHFPKERYRINISFATDPQRVDELKKEVFVQIDSLKNFGISEEYLKKVKEIHTRNYETNLRENSYWLNKIEFSLFNNLDPSEVLRVQEMIDALSLDDVQKAAQKYLNTDNYIEVILYPEDMKKPDSL
ncbi:MAG: insulinase family protein [Calditrichaeota bacterium]|nr:insulinase family protein [Calditrichota bacterium]